MIGEKLRVLRKRNNYTQQDIANKLNISRQAISNWENDKSYPDLDNIQLLAQIYDISVDNIIQLNSIPLNRNNTETVKWNEIFLLKTIIFSAHFLISTLFPISNIMFFLPLITAFYMNKNNRILKQLFYQSIVFIFLKTIIVLTVLYFYFFPF